jgi:hypothetical protein
VRLRSLRARDRLLVLLVPHERRKSHGLRNLPSLPVDRLVLSEHLDHLCWHRNRLDLVGLPVP